MPSLKNVSIGTRLMAGFGLQALLLLLVAGLALMGLSRVYDQTALTVHDRVAKVNALNEVMRLADRNARSMLIMVQTDDAGRVAQQMELSAAGRARITELLKDLEGRLKMPEARVLYATLVEKRTAYAKTLGRITEAVKADDRRLAQTVLYDELLPQQDAFFAAVDALLAYQRKLMDQGVESALAAHDEARNIVTLVVAVSLLLAAVFAWRITATVTGGVRKARDAAESLAAGDLSHRIEVDSTDEIGRMLAALQQAINTLSGMLATVRGAALQVSAGAAQLAAGNQDLSARTSEQAASLEETAAAVEQLTGTVRSNAESAREADRLARHATETAQASSGEVARVVNTMHEISASGDRIASIISVIDGIAFQTNILALNAAVEAARAGEQGRGFAVVAAEVRTLAQRSTEAAREIKGLIEQSVTSVATGVRVVDGAVERIGALTGSVQRLGELVAGIATASNEQSTGLEQVNSAVAQLDRVTQQNASLVEELAATGSAFGEQAGTVERAVSTFRLESVH